VIILKKILVQIGCSVIISVAGLFFSAIAESLTRGENTDSILNFITFLILYLIGVVCFFGLRIIYLLKNRNIIDEKRDNVEFEKNKHLPDK